MLWNILFERWVDAAGYGQVRYIIAAITAFAVSLVTGAYLIRRCHRNAVFEDTSQPDHEGLNRIQSKKQKVPTMGGLMIVAGVLAALLLWSDVRSAYTVTGILCMLAFAGLGFLDDYLKLNRRHSRGLRMMPKLALVIIISVAVATLLFLNVCAQNGATWFRVPFFAGGSFDMGIAYVAWSVLVLAATSNAVNLADGMDGLAAGCAVTASGALLALGVLLAHFSISPASPSPAIYGGEQACLIAAAVLGSALGFLWYNVHPAQIFMGDTGALAVGGLLGYVALGLKLEIPLLAAGAVFFVDELSVFLQIVVFKVTRKRVFPIAPIHHYFQLALRWPEQKITARLWIVAALGALVSFALIQFRGTP